MDIAERIGGHDHQAARLLELGVDVERRTVLVGWDDTVEQWAADQAGTAATSVLRLITHLGETNGPTLAVGATALAMLFGIARVAPRVPGGLVAYPSSVVMNVVPAQEAGVGSLAVTSPAQREFGGNAFEHDGDLTIRGITKPVTLRGEYAGMSVSPQGASVLGFSAKTTVDREAWDITWNAALETGGMLLGKKVERKV